MPTAPSDMTDSVYGDELHPLEQSYEHISMSSQISDEDARTVSITDRSDIDDRADDFSIINSEDGQSSSEEEEEGAPDHDDEETPGLHSAATFTAESLHASNLTVTGPSRGSAGSENDSETEMSGPEQPRPLVKRRKSKKRPAKTVEATGIKAVYNAVVDRVMAHPFLSTMALAAIQVALISSITAYKMSSATAVHLPHADAPQMPSLTRVSFPTDTTVKSKAHTATVSGFGTVDPPSIRRANPTPSSLTSSRSSLKSSSPTRPAKATSDLSKRFSSGTSGDSIRCNLEAQGDEKCPLDLLVRKEPSGHDFLIQSKWTSPWRLRFSVSATRRNRPVKFQLTNLRRSTYLLQFEPEDAHGTIELLLRGKDFRGHHDNREQRETLHFPNTWSDIPDLPKRIGQGASKLSEAASDAASKVVEAINEEVLAPAQAVTKALSLHIGPEGFENHTRAIRTSATKALQRLDTTTKDLIHYAAKKSLRLTATLARAEHQIDATLARFEHDVARKIHTASAYVLGDITRALSRLTSSDAAETLASLAETVRGRLTEPIGRSKTALRRAQGNARGLADKLSRGRMGGRVEVGDVGKAACGGIKRFGMGCRAERRERADRKERKEREVKVYECF